MRQGTNRNPSATAQHRLGQRAESAPRRKRRAIRAVARAAFRRLRSCLGRPFYGRCRQPQILSSPFSTGLRRSLGFSHATLCRDINNCRNHLYGQKSADGRGGSMPPPLGELEVNPPRRTKYRMLGGMAEPPEKAISARVSASFRIFRESPPGISHRNPHEQILPRQFGWQRNSTNRPTGSVDIIPVRPLRLQRGRAISRI